MFRKARLLSNDASKNKQAKAAFYLACDGGRLPRACKRYNELAAQGD